MMDLLLPGIGLILFLVVWHLVFFGNLDPKRKRRRLQNLVQRAYAFAAWTQAIAKGLDQGVATYYRVRALPRPTPQAERQFPAVDPTVRPAIIQVPDRRIAL